MTSGISVELKLFAHSEFTAKQLLGTGEFGEYFVAKHPDYEYVTLKEISHDLHNNKKKLEKEARDLYRVSSKYVVGLLGVVCEPRNVCLVTEYMEFGSLEYYMSKLPLDQYFGWPIRIRVLYQTAKGLGFLHDKGIIHQRLEPSIIMLDAHLNVKLAECGLRQLSLMATWSHSAQTHQQTISSHRRPTITVAHHAPEIILNINHQPDPSTDMYAYGILLWHIATTKIPFQGYAASEVLKMVSEDRRPGDVPHGSDVPALISELIPQCWSGDPSMRPEISHVLNGLQHLYKRESDSASNIAFAATKWRSDYSHIYNLPLLATSTRQRFFVDTPSSTARQTERNKPVCHPTGEHSAETESELTTAKVIRNSGQYAYRRHDQHQFDGEADTTLKATGFLEQPEPVRQPSPAFTTDNLSTMPQSSSSSSGDYLEAESLYSSSIESASRMESPTVPYETNISHTVSRMQTTNPIPLEGAMIPIEPKHLYQIATHMGNRWRRFGEIILGFSHGELDNFEYGQSELKDVVYKMLVHWVDNNGGKFVLSVGRLIAELKQGGLVDVARRVTQ